MQTYLKYTTKVTNTYCDFIKLILYLLETYLQKHSYYFYNN